MGIRANGNLGHLLARRQKLLEKTRFNSFTGENAQERVQKVHKMWYDYLEKNKTRSLKVENKQMALKMGSRANGILGSILENKRLNGIPFARDILYANLLSKSELQRTITFIRNPG